MCCAVCLPHSYVICQVHLFGKYIPVIILLYQISNLQTHLSCSMPSWQWCNNSGILSFMMEILLSDSVSYGKVLASIQPGLL